ncbi:hypothetical protein GCM10020001_114070 [Nonomuraea salmonea]
MTWIVTAFGWAIAIGTPLMAGLQSHQGVRRALLTCAALVALGAVLVVSLPSLPSLVLGSAAQGLGTAGFTTIAMSLTRSARSMGLVTAALATVGATAPLIADLVGGLLSWQAGLALPVLSLLAVPCVLRHRPAGPAPDAPFDPVGAVLLTALVTALVFVPHSWTVAGTAAVAAGGLLALHLRSRRDGFLPASIVRAPVFLLVSGLAFLLAATNFGMIYLLPALLAGQADWTSGQVGAAILGAADVRRAGLLRDDRRHRESAGEGRCLALPRAGGGRRGAGVPQRLAGRPPHRPGAYLPRRRLRARGVRGTRRRRGARRRQIDGDGPVQPLLPARRRIRPRHRRRARRLTSTIRLSECGGTKTHAKPVRPARRSAGNGTTGQWDA